MREEHAAYLFCIDLSRAHFATTAGLSASFLSELHAEEIDLVLRHGNLFHPQGDDKYIQSATLVGEVGLEKRLYAVELQRQGRVKFYEEFDPPPVCRYA